MIKVHMRFEHLDEFLGAYFHQDWDDIDRTADDVVRRFLGEASREDVNNVVGDIDEVLRTLNGEAEVAALLKEIGCYYEVSAGGFTPSEWLWHVRDLLLEPIAHANA
jgi:hypothetical protein